MHASAECLRLTRFCRCRVVKKLRAENGLPWETLWTILDKGAHSSLDERKVLVTMCDIEDILIPSSSSIQVVRDLLLNAV
jgi:hypothetical protein